jgi:nitric oxide reductase NorE protein
MSVRSTAVPRSPRAIPGEAGLWLFLLADMTVFAVFFAATVVVRSGDHALFARSSEQLHQGLGTVNTLLLLTGSACVALALRAFRAGASVDARRLVDAGIACACAFVAIKAVEWTDLLRHDHAPSSNDFFQLYFLLTGLHTLHVVGGTIALLVIRGRVVRAAPTIVDTQIVEGAASYWHMVDLLWLVLFPLLYLLR